MLVFPFLILEQPTPFKESMVNWLSNLSNHNRSAAKISQVLCSNRYTSLICSQKPLPVISGQFKTTTDTNRNQATPTDVPDTHNDITTHFVSRA